MARETTQPLTEMSTRNEADNLTTSYEPIAYKMWEPQHLTALWTSMANKV
jgi:hypothetical protein